MVEVPKIFVDKVLTSGLVLTGVADPQMVEFIYKYSRENIVKKDSEYDEEVYLELLRNPSTPTWVREDILTQLTKSEFHEITRSLFDDKRYNFTPEEAETLIASYFKEYGLNEESVYQIYRTKKLSYETKKSILSQENFQHLNQFLSSNSEGIFDDELFGKFQGYIDNNFDFPFFDSFYPEIFRKMFASDSVKIRDFALKNLTISASVHLLDDFKVESTLSEAEVTKIVLYSFIRNPRTATEILLEAPVPNSEAVRAHIAKFSCKSFDPELFFGQELNNLRLSVINMENEFGTTTIINAETLDYISRAAVRKQNRTFRFKLFNYNQKEVRAVGRSHYVLRSRAVLDFIKLFNSLSAQRNS